MRDKYREFEWDEFNSGKNLQKHGVSDLEIEQVFGNPYVIIRHKRFPDRRIVLGMTYGGRYLFSSVQLSVRNTLSPNSRSRHGKVRKTSLPKSDRQQKEIAMTKKRRKKKDIEIDELTANDSLLDADVSSAEVVFPGKKKKMAINMRLEPEAVKLAKQLAALKHLDGYTQLLRIYIWEGIERDRTILSQLQRKR